MRVGPFVLEGDYDARHVDVLRSMLAQNWPWHVLATGSRGRVLVSVKPADVKRFRAIWFYADQSVRIGVEWDEHMPRTIAHEVGHAFESFLPSPRQDTQRQIAGLLGVGSWSAPGEPWHRRPKEAVAEWFAWLMGTTDATALAPRGWSREPVNLTWGVTGGQIAEVVRTRLDEVRMFTDVEADHPHREGIEWAAGQGLAQGYPDGTFRPEQPVTRGQLATILMRRHRRTDA